MPNEVITKFREKFPQYDNISDEELTIRVGERYPAYFQHEDFKQDFERFRLQRTPSMRPVMDVFPGITLRDAGPSEPFTGRAPKLMGGLLPPTPAEAGLAAREETAGKSTLQVAKELAFAPYVEVPPEVVAVASPAAQQINMLFGPEAAKGYSDAVAEMASSMLSPGGVGAAAVGAVGAVPAASIGALFSLDALFQSPEQAERLRDAFASGNRTEIGREVTAAVALAGQTVLGVLPGVKLATDLRKANAPLTAQAVSEAMKPKVEPRPSIPITERATGSEVGGLPEAFVKQPETAVAGESLRMAEPVRVPPEGGIVPTPELLATLPRDIAESVPINTVLDTLGPPASSRRIRALVAALPDPQQGIPLSGKRVFFADPEGNVMLGTQAKPEGVRWENLTWEERVKLETDAELAVARDQDMAHRFQQTAQATPETIEEALPPEPSMPTAEAEQIATQFIQRVPSEAARGETAFERPAAPPEVLRPGEVMTGSPLEQWADTTIQRSKGAGIRPVSGEELLAAYAIKGAALFERGYRSLPEWGQKMLEIASVEGHDIRGQLRELYRRSQVVESSKAVGREEGQPPPVRREVPATGEERALPPTAPLTREMIQTRLKSIELPKKMRMAEDALLAYERQQPPPVIAPDQNAIMEPMPRADSIRAFNRRFAFGKLKDWLNITADPIQQSVKAFFGEQYGQRPAFKNVYEQSIRGRIDSAFEFSPEGRITNIQTRDKSVSTAISDVMEELLANPNSEKYALNAAQREALSRLQVERARLDEFRRRHNQIDKVDTEHPDSDLVSGDPTGNAYLSRIVTRRPDKTTLSEKIKELLGSRGRSVGGRQSIDKSRIFTTEEEGIQAGFKYAPSIEARLVHELDSVYKKIFDQRLADDANLVWETPKAIRERTRSEYADEIASGEKTSEAVDQIAENRIARGRIAPGGKPAPAFQERIFSKDDAKFLNEALKDSESLLRHGLAKASRTAKITMLGADLGIHLNQLLINAYSHPIIQAKTIVKSLEGMLSEKNILSYYRNNTESIREMAQTGHPIGETPELIGGLGRGEWIDKIPGGKQAFAPFERLFRAGMDVAAVELWKAYRTAGMTPEQALLQMRTIESMIGQTRGLSQGKPPARVVTEQALALAWSYYAGGMNLMGTLLNGRKPALMAARALGGYVAAMPMLFYVGAKALEKLGHMTEGEIEDRFDPSRGDFMAWKVPTAGGRYINVPAPGAFYRSLIRLSGKLWRKAKEDPSAIVSLNPDESPIAAWVWTHSSPPISEAMTQVKGHDPMGREATLAGTPFRLMAPLAARDVVASEGNVSGAQRATMAIAQFLGLSAFPESPSAALMAEREKLSQQRQGKNFVDLPVSEQVKITKELQGQERFQRTERTPFQVSRSIESAQRKIERLTSALSESNRALLDELNLEISGFDSTITRGRTKIAMTKEQLDKLEPLVVKEYDLALDKHADALRKMNDKRRKEHLSKILSDARLRAERQLTK